ncbi:MAG: ribosome biogenesis GTPase Der [Thermoanaerobaculia bacterium]
MKQVVIVGRPNVGKSTLFNRLAGRRRALTHDLPGMTRDRLTLEARLDDGRRFSITDTGGLEFGDHPMSEFATEIREQAEAAIAESDLVLFVVDGPDGVVSEDRDIARALREGSRKVIVVVNKIDRSIGEASVNEFHELGFSTLMAISAEHGTNIEEIIDVISEMVPPLDATTEEEAISDAVRVAIIGRPNVGKSSLLNRLMGKQRVVVSEISGTTRDAIDERLEREGKSYLIIDTAGIRRKGKTTDEAEKLAVISARKAIERAEVVILVVDGLEGIAAQDAHVAGYAEEAGRAAIIVVNKWDAVERAEGLTTEFESQVRRRLKFLEYAPLEFISAKYGRRVEKLFGRIDEIAQNYRARFRTARLNEILEKAINAHHPPTAKRGKQRRFYYATQLKAAPPTIGLFSNVAEPIHFSYRRYLENQFREALGLHGTPIHFVIRGRKGMKDSPGNRPERDQPRKPTGKPQRVKDAEWREKNEPGKGKSASGKGHGAPGRGKGVPGKGKNEPAKGKPVQRKRKASPRKKTR